MMFVAEQKKNLQPVVRDSRIGCHGAIGITRRRGCGQAEVVRDLLYQLRPNRDILACKSRDQSVFAHGVDKARYSMRISVNNPQSSSRENRLRSSAGTC